MALGQDRPEGGVAAGKEAAGIAEVLKSERAGRHLPLEEEQIIASAELVAEQGMTADAVRSNLGEADLFEAYADTFAKGIGKERRLPIQMALAKKWWMDARPAPQEKKAEEVSSPPEAAAAAAEKVETIDAGTSCSDLKTNGKTKTELSVMAEQLRAMGCTADEAIGLSGVILYGKWINRSQRPDIGYGDSLCALKTFRELQQVLLASDGHFANERFYGKCHWCGQKGHRESDCPAKARGDARI